MRSVALVERALRDAVGTNVRDLPKLMEMEESDCTRGSSFQGRAAGFFGLAWRQCQRGGRGRGASRESDDKVTLGAIASEKRGLFFPPIAAAVSSLQPRPPAQPVSPSLSRS